MREVARHRTALTRSFLSSPVQQLMTDGLLEESATFFDYGCGKGDDVRSLRNLGYQAWGWDPAHASDQPMRNAAVVNLGYVVNVIEDLRERKEALTMAWALANEVLVVSARMNWEVSSSPGRSFGDGWLTQSGSFQKFFSQEELRGWIDATLGLRCVAAAPGIFYVFRSEIAVQRLLARHTRRGSHTREGIAELIYRRHQDLLDRLGDWVDQNRKLPTPADPRTHTNSSRHSDRSGQRSRLFDG